VLQGQKGGSQTGKKQSNAKDEIIYISGDINI
jgi:hypothetical protein